ncbi:class Ib ribonucleoside-diphosphate reductase assembly flavoprotein NrdI [Martelella lutilitoris]|uniref:Protein NrdI n=1 Tax=Martelella lutilitoris TaxID=2583532 RepID=A0A7T7KLS1_9HYPH|nr:MULTISPECIES: class Ib ribonucleoside-diphosphate reductase assembly flavoprotein NrdI [Martelella]AMM86476.1 ribonucleotide reductase stimulatory protein [Martelella sp. AD-3]QQM30813.1 class Ib ribonucleoside-diphosphate reductase assembly flavoprotein NrdI [Martelella lutilitoris]
MTGMLVYYSSATGNTHRFVTKTGLEARRLGPQGDTETVDAPYVLVVPTYAGGDGRGAVPKPVIRFLNNPENRALIRGVIASGNTNFGETYGIAGDIISAKCKVPYLYRFELLGTEEDVINVRQGLEEFWKRQN